MGLTCQLSETHSAAYVGREDQTRRKQSKASIEVELEMKG
jgi:hypothetical protein